MTSEWQKLGGGNQPQRPKRELEFRDYLREMGRLEDEIQRRSHDMWLKLAFELFEATRRKP